jgi:transcription elongation factor Elf1
VGDVCQYCGADLEASPPVSEVGWLYGVECSRCPPERRQSHILARRAPVAELVCPDCGARIAPADGHADVLVVKEMTYDVCPACGERCGVSAVRKVRDVSGGTM